MDDDFAITLELFLFASNIKKQICGILDSFLSFLGKYEERKVHNMLSLMSYSQFKNFCLVSSFVGCKQGISIIKEWFKVFATHVFEMLSSFTSCEKLWCWIYRA